MRRFFCPPLGDGGNFRCVAPLYALLINDLKVQVSDTTKMSKNQQLVTKNIH